MKRLSYFKLLDLDMRAAIPFLPAAGILGLLISDSGSKDVLGMSELFLFVLALLLGLVFSHRYYSKVRSCLATGQICKGKVLEKYCKRKYRGGWHLLFEYSFGGRMYKRKQVLMVGRRIFPIAQKPVRHMALFKLEVGDEVTVRVSPELPQEGCIEKIYFS